MPFQQSIVLLDDESILAECGPMRLIIRAWKRGQPQTEIACQAAKESFSFLESLARFRPELSLPFKKKRFQPEDNLARVMLKSVKAVGDDDLTPMAAVAGTIADAVADWLFDRGMSKVLVDNGGDIAIRLAENETATVGVRPKINSMEISHVIRLDDRSPSWGVTTSGLGGRSLTRGIASAVTALADSASAADAAATSIANQCYVEDNGIVQVPAEQIDPDTDLTGIKVTVKMNSLSREKILSAVDKAFKKADYLSQKKIIIGAFIALEDVFAMTKSMEEFVTRA